MLHGVKNPAATTSAEIRSERLERVPEPETVLLHPNAPVHRPSEGLDPLSAETTARNWLLACEAAIRAFRASRASGETARIHRATHPAPLTPHLTAIEQLAGGGLHGALMASIAEALGELGALGFKAEAGLTAAVRRGVVSAPRAQHASPLAAAAHLRRSYLATGDDALYRAYRQARELALVERTAVPTAAAAIARGRARVPPAVFDDLRAALKEAGVSTEPGASDLSFAHLARSHPEWIDTEAGRRAVAAIEAWRSSLLSDVDEAHARTIALGFDLHPSALAVRSRAELVDQLTEVVRWLGPTVFLAFDRVTAEEARAVWRPGSRVVDIGKTGAPFTSLLHECAHAFEALVPERMTVLAEWVMRRAGGRPPESLAEMTGLAYATEERARPDDFFHPYVGRAYPEGFTEVLSMGVERFATAETMAVFMAEDPEHFFLTLGMVRP